MINDEQAVAMTTISSQALESKKKRYRNEKGEGCGMGQRERGVCRVLACVWKASVERVGAEAARLTQSSLGNRANETQTINLPLFR